MERRNVWRHLRSCSGTPAQKPCLFTWRKRVPADTLSRVAGNRHKGAKWLPCCMWEACIDCVLSSGSTPPHLLSSSVFPRDSCAPSVVHGRAVKMLLPRFFFPLLSSPLLLPFHPLFPRLPLPSPTDSSMSLFTSPPTCVFLAHAVCAERGMYMRERACPWICTASATRLPLEKLRDVIDCYSHSNSESAPSVGTPPPLSSVTTPAKSSSLLRQQRMLVPPWGERAGMRRKKWGEGRKLICQMSISPVWRRLFFLRKQMLLHLKKKKSATSKHLAFTHTFIQIVAYVTGAAENQCASGLVRTLMWRAALR